MQTSFDFLTKSASELLDFLPFSYFLVTKNATVTDCNIGASNVLQLPREKIIGRSLQELLPLREDGQPLKLAAEDLDSIHETLDRTLAGAQRPDGSLLWLRLRTRQVKAQDADDDALIVSAANVTEQRQIFDTIRSTIQESDDLLDSVLNAVFFCDISGKVHKVNRNFRTLCETDAESLNVLNLIDNASARTNLAEDFQKLANGEISEIHQEVVLKTGKGALFDALLMIGVYRSKDSTQHMFVGSVENITAFRLRDEEKMKASKFEALALLSSGIAHDLNNIMLAITANLELAGMDITNQENVTKFINDALLAARRACELAKGLMTFAKGGNPVKEVTDITSHVISTIQFALRGSNLVPSFQMAPDLLPVDVDLSQFNQVLDNLVINAREASANGGVLEVRAVNREIADGSIQDLRPGWYVGISIKDCGVGISEENLSRIFDPYFSTKTYGSGIGLSTCYSILKRHQGVIMVNSEKGKGSEFIVLLPAASPLTKLKNEKAAKEMVAAMSMPAPVEKENERKGRVLIVDDEAMILNILKSMLKNLGYNASTANSTEDALVMYKEARESNTPFNVVVLDATIPGGIGGEAALRQFLKIDPEACVIICSGYTNNKVMTDYENIGFKGRLEKPFQVAELGAVLKKVLSATPDPVPAE
ncbi:MAG: ATP-binding protein [Chthoniobacterales bacterium]